MANPTESSVQTQIGQAFLALDELDRKITRDAVDPTSQRIDEMIQSLEGDYSSASAAGIEAFRSFAGSVTASSVSQGMVDGHVLDYGKVLDFSDLTVVDLLERLRRDFQNNAKTIQTRGVTYNPASAGGGNTGNGDIIRLTQDEFDFDLEGITAETKKFRCNRDAPSGTTKHQEEFEIGGEDPPKDNVAGFRSTDRQAVISSISADNSLNYIQNPSFGQQLDPTSADLATALPGWEITTAVANLTSRTDTFYKDSSSEGTVPASLEFTATEKITQRIDVNGGAFDPRLPYYFHVAYRLGTAAVGTGSIDITMGNATASFDLTTISDTNWRVLRIAADKDTWYRIFNKAALEFSVEVKSQSGNSVIMDDITIEQYAAFDGSFWAIVGGATPALVDDTFALTDTANAPETSIIGYWLWRTYGVYLPAGGAPTWTEPVP